MKDSRDAGQEGCRTGGMQDRRDGGHEGWRKRGTAIFCLKNFFFLSFMLFAIIFSLFTRSET